MPAKQIIAVALVGLGVAACSANSGPKEVGGTAAGAVAGGVIGNAIGGSTGNRLAGTLVGAAIGGFLGNRIGAKLCRDATAGRSFDAALCRLAASHCFG